MANLSDLVSVPTGGLVGLQVFETSGTYTPGANTRAVKVYVTGGAASRAFGIYSAGAGSTAIKYIEVGFSSASLTVGSVDGDSIWNDGTNVVEGGAGNGRTGGTATGGDINIRGGDGESSYSSGEHESVGGSSAWGNAPAYGGGGNLAESTTSQPGVIIVEEYE